MRIIPDLSYQWTGWNQISPDNVDQVNKGGGAMLNDFFLYLAGIFVLVGGVLRLERIVVGPHSTAGSGYARLDSAFDFDRLRRKQHGARAPSPLPRRARPILPSLREVVHNYRHLRDAGEQFIPIASIVGSVDGGSQLFDRNFRPSVTEPAPGWAAWWPCAKVSRCRPSRCTPGAAGTTFSTAITGLPPLVL
jgi:hypothetical protein